MLKMCREHGYFRSEECPICGEEGKFLMSPYELESLGRIMAGILRHFPERFELEMDEEGFVDLYKLVTAIKRKRGERVRWLRPTHIIGLVETDYKGRYQLEDNYVRATYGHSISLNMSLPTDNIPSRLYYPTTESEQDVLLKEGISPTDRTMVHLSKTHKNAFEAGAHRSEEDPIILRVDAERAQDNGIIIQRAGKTVFTVEEVPADFLSLADEEDVRMAEEEDEEESLEPTTEGQEEPEEEVGVEMGEIKEVEGIVEEILTEPENDPEEIEDDLSTG